MIGYVFYDLHTNKLKAQSQAASLRERGKRVRVIPGSMRVTHQKYWSVLIKSEYAAKPDGFKRIKQE